MGKNSTIAIFDSGVGGLSVYKSIKKLLPNEKIVYLADGTHFPYGDKTQHEVRRFTLRCLKFLANPLVARSLGEVPKLVVISCNTATVSGIDFYREQIPHIPIIGVVPVIKTAARETKNGRIAIISTVATARSKYQKDLIEKFCPGFHVLNLIPSTTPTSPTSPISPISLTSHPLLLNLGCPNLVHHVEQGITEGPEIEHELRQILKPVIAAECDVLALGCTHYPFLKRTIDRIIGPHVLFLDSGGAVARHAKRILEQNHMLNPAGPPQADNSGADLFLTTGNAKNFAEAIEKLLGIKTEVKSVKI